MTFHQPLIIIKIPRQGLNASKKERKKERKKKRKEKKRKPLPRACRVVLELDDGDVEILGAGFTLQREA